MSSTDKVKSKKFPVRLLFTLARLKELRKRRVEVVGITVGDISSLASVMFPDKSFEWSASILVAEQLGRLILKQHPCLSDVSLKGVSEKNYKEFVARAVSEVGGSKKLEIRPV